MSKLSFKKSIKEKIQNSTFDKLIRKREMHSKVKHIKYETLEMSDYLKPGVDQVCKEEAESIFSKVFHRHTAGKQREKSTQEGGKGLKLSYRSTSINTSNLSIKSAPTR